ncbi:MAG: tRNA preQ1(34) S-adenosylmethionine ribosyltransferase-isomerase QueA [Deltaproteobacteria bacterium]|nr:tRNA preQ1(34) S-adenosylmethionine ribosyltransferase-isomerase QueA [Deltaproteobacteria bacterium]
MADTAFPSLSDFSFELPEELIAQHPPKHRDSSRLMALNRQTGLVEHRNFPDILEYLKSGDVLVFNDTRVMPARLLGKKEGGGKAELLLVRKLGAEGKSKETWICMAKASKGFKPGARVMFEANGASIVATALRREDDAFWAFTLKSEDVHAAIHSIGRVPLPPYIRREDTEEDRARYQTVFAKEEGAVAAPTASLHFTNDMLGKIRAKGVETVYVTLHTGPLTFLPFREDTISKGLPGEYYNVTPEAYGRIKAAKTEGRRVVAVGSTVVRTLETVFAGNEPALSGASALLIFPGFEFKAVDALITNFHLPESTLLMMVAAFAGKDFIMKAYAGALKERYRFFSYGDCMVIV